MVSQAARNGSRDDITVLLLRCAARRGRAWLLLALLAGFAAWAVLGHLVSP
jgi:hypothetical protein